MAAPVPADGDILLPFMQHLEDDKCNQTARTLEIETGIYFNLAYFEGLVLNGEFDAADSYLGGFTNVNDNELSTKTFFELRKLKFIENMYRNQKAEDVLEYPLMDFYNDELSDYKFTEGNSLLELFDARTHDILLNYPGEEAARKIVMDLLKILLQDNPIICDKLQKPSIDPDVEINTFSNGEPKASPPSEGLPAPMEAGGNETNAPGAAEINTQK